MFTELDRYVMAVEDSIREYSDLVSNPRIVVGHFREEKVLEIKLVNFANNEEDTVLVDFTSRGSALIGFTEVLRNLGITTLEVGTSYKALKQNKIHERLRSLQIYLYKRDSFWFRLKEWLFS